MGFTSSEKIGGHRMRKENLLNAEYRCTQGVDFTLNRYWYVNVMGTILSRRRTAAKTLMERCATTAVTESPFIHSSLVITDPHLDDNRFSSNLDQTIPICGANGVKEVTLIDKTARVESAVNVEG